MKLPTKISPFLTKVSQTFLSNIIQNNMILQPDFYYITKYLYLKKKRNTKQLELEHDNLFNIFILM